MKISKKLIKAIIEREGEDRKKIEGKRNKREKEETPVQQSVNQSKRTPQHTQKRSTPKTKDLKPL